MKLTRHPNNPILEPIAGQGWESRNVFNCGVTNYGGEIVLIYRGQGRDNDVSKLGYAASRDGVRFERLADPVFVPETPDEVNGVEDPRLTLLDGRVQMLYTAWSPGNIQVARASTTDFQSWERHGIVIPGPDNKDAALFPRQVNDRYCAFHRIPSSMWIAWSDDLEIWGDVQRIMDPRPGCYDDLKLGAGGPPIETDQGWLVIYHGVDRNKVYCLGVALLDKDDPSKVINRPREPILVPEEPWELVGDVPNVVFTCGTAELGDDYLVYYGAADRVIGLATANRQDLLDYAANG
ncbi:MAG: glycosidase [Chloroflexota bacterium]|nr:glycosidase [Chloroflexota bacterium]